MAYRRRQAPDVYSPDPDRIVWAQRMIVPVLQFDDSTIPILPWQMGVERWRSGGVEEVIRL